MLITRATALVKSTFAFLATVNTTTSKSSSFPQTTPFTTTVKNEGLDPVLLRAARGDPVERTPVWMMRQAGRHMKVYRNLVEKYPTFRERSETPGLSYQISLQPYESYGVDGIILFSDILTPLPVMGCDFQVLENGKIHIEPAIRDRETLIKQMKLVTSKDYKEKIPFVGEVLSRLRNRNFDKDSETSETDTTITMGDVGDNQIIPPTTTAINPTILGFIGLPFTLGSYLIEGQTGMASNFVEIHRLIKHDPGTLHDILSMLTQNLVEYACYQIKSGAQVLQVFDSWAGHMEDGIYDTYCMPYQIEVINNIKQRHPDVPIIIYMAPGMYSRGGRRLGKLSRTGADFISVDHTVDIAYARKAIPESIGLQGNLNPELLRDGPVEEIIDQTKSILNKVAGTRHIMNLGHGIDPNTPEEHAALFIKTVQEYRPPHKYDL